MFNRQIVYVKRLVEKDILDANTDILEYILMQPHVHRKRNEVIFNEKPPIHVPIENADVLHAAQNRKSDAPMTLHIVTDFTAVSGLKLAIQALEYFLQDPKAKERARLIFLPNVEPTDYIGLNDILFYFSKNIAEKPELAEAVLEWLHSLDSVESRHGRSSGDVEGFLKQNPDYAVDKAGANWMSLIQYFQNDEKQVQLDSTLVLCNGLVGRVAFFSFQNGVLIFLQGNRTDYRCR